jgi:hypothetical protein
MRTNPTDFSTLFGSSFCSSSSLAHSVVEPMAAPWEWVWDWAVLVEDSEAEAAGAQAGQALAVDSVVVVLAVADPAEAGKETYGEDC